MFRFQRSNAFTFRAISVSFFVTLGMDECSATRALHAFRGLQNHPGKEKVSTVAELAIESLPLACLHN